MALKAKKSPKKDSVKSAQDAKLKKRASGIEIQKLAAKYSLRILPWNRKWIVFEETKSDVAFKPYFTIYFKEGTYRIALSGLLFYSLKAEVNEYWSLKSGRFKKCNSILSAVNWIARFFTLAMPDQVGVIETKNIQFRDAEIVKPYNHKGWRVVNNKAGASPRARLLYIGQFHNL
jgi:hypothetical protein